MLLDLHIKNFAIIDELELSFAPGLNILTGETGAGKSIVVDAVALLMGGRANTAMIRAGAEEAHITGLFDVSRLPQLKPVLAGLDITLDGNGDGDGQELILHRRLLASGRSRARIDGRPVTLTQLRQVGACLLDLHGQHAYHSLLAATAQKELLDEFIGPEAFDRRKQIAALHSEIAATRRKLRELTGDGRERMRAIDLYRFQVEEIDAAGFVPGEEEELRQTRRRLANATRIRQGLASAHERLAGAGGGADNDVDGALAQTIGLLEPLVEMDDTLNPWLQTLYTLQEEVAALARDLRHRAELTEADPAALAQAEDRLQQLNALKQKYGDTITEIIAYREEAAAQLARLEAAGAEEERLQNQLAAQRQKMGQLCHDLHQLRRQGAAKLKEQVEPVLAELGMAGAAFKAHLTLQPDREGVPVGDQLAAADATGADNVEFAISTNPGEPLRPLTQVASGGELSRIMLALKSLLTTSQQVPTVIFDEIDAGVGGQTASAVAAKLQNIARRHQVICVTHLPVIAAGAQRHFTVAKAETDGRTVTTVQALGREERERELARMLGGTAPATALAHARQLLRQTGSEF